MVKDNVRHLTDTIHEETLEILVMLEAHLGHLIEVHHRLVQGDGSSRWSVGIEGGTAGQRKSKLNNAKLQQSNGSQHMVLVHNSEMEEQGEWKRGRRKGCWGE